MAKILECAKVDPSSGCKHVVRGETVEEVLQKAGEHANRREISTPANRRSKRSHQRPDICHFL